MSRLADITPLVPVSDLDRAIRFFRDILGFRLGVQMEGYAYLRRDSAGIRLLQAAPDAAPNDPRRQQACYIDVEELDALYAELEPALSRLPAGRVRAPFDQPYGMREFHVTDEDNLLIFFGEDCAGR